MLCDINLSIFKQESERSKVELEIPNEYISEEPVVGRRRKDGRRLLLDLTLLL
jgi:hypothetical protein